MTIPETGRNSLGNDVEELRRSHYGLEYGKDLGSALYDLINAENSSEVSVLDRNKLRGHFAVKVEDAMSQGFVGRRKAIMALMDYSRNLPRQPKP